MSLFDNRHSNSLCIIGNGFDLHHGLETRYSDFRRFLVNQGYSHIVSQLESIFPAECTDDNGNHGYLLWSNLEEAIGCYDLDYVYHELTDWIKIDYDHMIRSASQIEDSADWLLAPLVRSLSSLIAEWISNLPYRGICPTISLPYPSIFISFNYTRTLEDIYHVPEKDVHHLHGVIGKTGLVVGHRYTADESEAFDERALIFEEEAKRNIISIMNECRKPTEEIISINRLLFQSLQTITDIYIYGHSYSSVDLDYFRVVNQSVPSDVLWHLGYHSDNDRAAANRLFDTLKVNQQNKGFFPF